MIPILSTAIALLLGGAIVLSVYRAEGGSSEPDGSSSADNDRSSALGEGPPSTQSVPMGRNETPDPPLSSDRPNELPQVAMTPSETPIEQGPASFGWDQMEALSGGTANDAPVWEIFVSRRIERKIDAATPVALHGGASIKQVFPAPTAPSIEQPRGRIAGIDPVSQLVVDWLTTSGDTDVIEIPLAERRRDVLSTVLQDARADIGRGRVAYVLTVPEEDRNGIAQLLLAGEDNDWWTVWIYIERGEMIDLEYATITEEL